jgi:diaminopimelate decarboxylase
MDTIELEKIVLELLNKYTTPFYFYRRKVLEETIVEMKNAFSFPGFQLLFATMANDNNDFIRMIVSNEVGACVNSINHLNLVLDCGLSPHKIQFTSSGLREEDMDLLYAKGITVNFDSLNQVEKWLKKSEGRRAGLRINTGSLTDKLQLVDRLGISKKEVLDVMKIAEKYKGIIDGLHIYVGTNFRSHTDMLPALIEFFELASIVPTLDYVNIGGGIGVDYLHEGHHFDIREYGEIIRTLNAQLESKLGKNIRVIFEPGRRLAASSGVFVTRITDIKILNDIRYVVVDASVSIFPRPFQHPDSPHQVIVPFKNNAQEYADAVVVGRTTFSRDIMSKMPLIRNLHIGDIILFDQAGAYCDSMRSKFLGQNEPLNIFVDE